MEILRESLGAKILELNAEEQSPFLVPIFSKGPFRVLYPGFPVGDIPPGYCTLLSTRNFPRGEGGPIHMVRIWQSQLLQTCRFTSGTTNILHETVIEDLQAWAPDRLPGSIHRNLKRARKSGLQLEPPSTSDSTSMFRLYESTVTRRGGALRYNQKYFHSLAAQSRHNDSLDPLVARTPDGRIAGMIVTAYHNGRAFYLHGGLDESCQSLRPSDLLMSTAILRAKAAGMQSFSFLPSPADQPGLIRFKEKWGGTTYLTPTRDLFTPSLAGTTLRFLLTLKQTTGIRW